MAAGPAEARRQDPALARATRASIAPRTDVSQIGREPWKLRTDRRTFRRRLWKKNFSPLDDRPRTDLDDRPRLGGKTPPSPGRRVPVDSPEDRRFSNRSKSHRRCRHAMETSHGRSDGRSDAGYGRKKFSPRTDLDDRPRLGGKTPPSPGRRVPVDSPEDRRFSNRSKSHRRCRHAMETSHGRSDGRSDAGYGSRVRLGTVGEAPHCGSRTPDFAVFLVRDSAKDYRRDANAGRRPPLAVSCRRRHRLWDAGDRVSISRRKNFLLEPTSTTGRRSAARPRPRPGDACRSIAPRTDVSQIGPNRVAVAGTPWKLRTDVPTDVPTPVMEGNFLLEPTSTTGRGSAGDPALALDACRSIAPRTDVSQIGQNRIAVAGTPWKLRTDVPTDVPTPAMAAGSDSERWGKLLTVGVALRTLPFFWYGIPQKTTGATQTPAGDRRLRSRAGAGTGYGTQATASRYLEEIFFLLEPTSTTGRRSAARPRPRPGDACRSIAPRTDVSQIGPNRIAVAGTPWKLRTDVPTDVPTPVMEEKKGLLEPTSTTGRRSAARPRPRPGDACRSIAPRTDVSQTPAGCRHATAACGIVKGPAPAMVRRRRRLDISRKNFLLEPTSTTGRGSAARPRPRPGDACRSIAPSTDVSQIGPNRIAVAGTPWRLRTDVPTDVPTPVMEEKNFLLEPTSTTGRGSAARPRPRPGDACRSIAPRTDVSQIGPNRIAVAGTPWKLRTDVPTDVPTPAMPAGSDSVRRGMLLRDFAKIG